MTYIVADISRPIAAEVMIGAEAVIHCAAETAGGWEQHQKNSIRATEEVLQAAGAANVKRMIHISSISTLAVPTRGDPLTDDGPLETNSRSGGPYAWGKIESERLAVSRCKDLGIDLRIVRPSALVDYRHFDPPGLLGKRIGNVFVAVGMPGILGVVDVVFSAQTLAWMVRHFDEAPRVLNLFQPELPTKRNFLRTPRRANWISGRMAIPWLLPCVIAIASEGPHPEVPPSTLLRFCALTLWPLVLPRSRRLCAHALPSTSNNFGFIAVREPEALAVVSAAGQLV